jgi:hypothetical protein
MYAAYERDRREAAHLAYVSDLSFPVIEAEARERGFRKATLSEIHASAENRGPYTPDLYSWKGGLWVHT